MTGAATIFRLTSGSRAPQPEPRFFECAKNSGHCRSKPKALLSILVDAQEYACARLNLQSALVRFEDDDTDRISSSSVRDLHMCESVGSAGVGRKNPKGLESAIVIELSSTAHGLIGAHADQNSTVDGVSEHVFSILA